MMSTFYLTIYFLKMIKMRVIRLYLVTREYILFENSQFDLDKEKQYNSSLINHDNM